jgi:hypothetical protein
LFDQYIARKNKNMTEFLTEKVSLFVSIIVW